jgi:hypothetical protein
MFGCQTVGSVEKIERLNRMSVLAPVRQLPSIQGGSMPNIALDGPRPLPTWIKIVGSVVIAVHFLAIGGVVVNARSGPWLANTFFPGPQFAAPIDEAASPYLLALRMTHTYRFRVDRPMPSVYFEAHLKDGNGQPLKTLRFPDAKANFWVRHRQQLLADGLFGDAPVPPPQGERLGAPPKTIWEPAEKQMVLKTVPEHLVPRSGQVMSPSDWSLLVAKSYAQHLCRIHGAASAEIVRHSRDIVLPPTLLPPPPPGKDRSEAPPALFEELVFNFGVYRRED